MHCDTARCAIEETEGDDRRRAQHGIVRIQRGDETGAVGKFEVVGRAHGKGAADVHGGVWPEDDPGGIDEKKIRAGDARPDRAVNGGGAATCHTGQDVLNVGRPGEGRNVTRVQGKLRETVKKVVPNRTAQARCDVVVRPRKWSTGSQFAIQDHGAGSRNPGRPQKYHDKELPPVTDFHPITWRSSRDQAARRSDQRKNHGSGARSLCVTFCIGARCNAGCRPEAWR